MKARQVEELLKNRGMERGTVHMLTYLVERNNALESQLNQMAQMQMQMVDTLQNVVTGTTGMRTQMIKTLRENGINVESEDDGLGPSTQHIGEQ